MSNESKPLRQAAEMYPLIESYLDSGLTQKQFYRQQELPHHVFSYWLRHYRKHNGLSSDNLRRKFLS